MSDVIIHLYRSMYLIRRFEETVLENFSKGIFFGTTHASIGQEANAVGVLVNLQEGDVVFSNHRCHGHFLAYGGDTRQLFAELMGRSTGVCGGRGGSQHLHWKTFYSNGVQGGIVPIATGFAFAEKSKQSGAIVIAFIGDGTLGEGVIYESFNMASLWQLPVLYVLENNHIAQTTPSKNAVAGNIASRFEAFGIPVREFDTSDVLIIAQAASETIDAVRVQQSPSALIFHTCRFAPHSKGDDTRSEDDINLLRLTRDPLEMVKERINPKIYKKIEKEVDIEINNAYQQALADPFPKPQ
jgi:TPP-dependent pyruvate/acetoin dehydrogenase alpha subunit